MTDMACLEIEQEGAITIVRLNRPEVLNAIGQELREAFVDALIKCNQDAAVSSIVITGTGDRAFCAGQDLREIAELTPSRAKKWVATLPLLYEAIRDLNKPSVVALNGLAAGAGLQIALHADVCIAHHQVRMGQPEVNAGLPSILGPFVMEHAMGWARTRELSLSGRLIDAKTCLLYGMLREIVPAERILPRALEIAQELSTKPSTATRLSKQRYREKTQSSWEEVLRAFRTYAAEAFATGDPQRVAREFLSRSQKQI